MTKMIKIIKNKDKSRKKIKKINKENIGLVLLYFKIFRIFKFCFIFLVFASIIHFTFLFYKNNTLKKIANSLDLKYSELALGDMCNNIEVSGIERASIEKIQKDIYNFCNSINKNSMKPLLNVIISDPWIKNVAIERKLPDTLKIQIEEYLPFAIWKNGNELYLMDENGKIIEISEREKRTYCIYKRKRTAINKIKRAY